jgi:hypothetical protein
MKYLKLYEQFRLLLEADEKKDNNILYNLSQGGEKTLILLPGAGKAGGQGKDNFQLLANKLEDFSVYTADFENKLDVREYAKKIADEIESNEDIKQCAVGGFSIGAGMAWHLAKALKGSKKFNNKLFFIDGGIANSTKEFAENIVTKANTPRVAMAQPFDIFIKNRDGGKSITAEEEKKILNFRSVAELNAFKNRADVKNNYKEYMGTIFPPSTEEIEKESKGNNPWIIEDKYDKTNFEKRYSVKPKNLEGMSFKKGDVVDLRNFVESDTLQKKGLGRETESGEMLPPLDGVKVISLIAGNKEGKPKSKEDIEACKKEAAGSTSGESEVIVISDSEHGNITKSPALATNISSSFKSLSL